MIFLTFFYISVFHADFENLNDALEGVCKIFEENLKKTHTTSPQITYDVSQLFDFVDELRDISCLVLDKKSFKYSPYRTVKKI